MNLNLALLCPALLSLVMTLFPSCHDQQMIVAA